ncbi:histidine kinase [Sphingobacterium oryzagri]|uniref:Histidine kinase n=1 Tax=Sphingobacterium oryzagri TaxID=3025669 RepID=A0ABY7WB31_9SPHI|nr:histidine kinase [Sphingobacterium sp. KACC 22765]WDF66876.1 histidine kinase [Sphingobacterium sp. KACC 22765]
MRLSNYNRVRLYGYPSFAVLLYLVLVLLNPYDTTLQSWRVYMVLDFALEFFYCFVLATIFLETGIQITRVLNRFYPWQDRIKRRIAVQLVLHIGMVYLLLTIFSKIHFPAHFGYNELLLRQAIILGVIVSILCTVIFTTEHLFYRWNFAKFQSLQLKNLNTQARLDALNLQLDPHFLFNNLSTVNALIEDSPHLAIEYVSRLSTIYRYILSAKRRSMVPLEEELAFIHHYLFLYKIRYGDAIQVSFETHADAESVGLPPLTLQLLIENAIKHNTFSLLAPLHLRVLFPDRESVVIENSVKAKLHPEGGEKMGLSNIMERYQLLNLPAPLITNDGMLFQVKLTLSYEINQQH